MNQTGVRDTGVSLPACCLARLHRYSTCVAREWSRSGVTSIVAGAGRGSTGSATALASGWIGVVETPSRAERRPMRYNSTPGLTRAQMTELIARCGQVHSGRQSDDQGALPLRHAVRQGCVDGFDHGPAQPRSAADRGPVRRIKSPRIQVQMGHTSTQHSVSRSARELKPW